MQSLSEHYEVLMAKVEDLIARFYSQVPIGLGALEKEIQGAIRRPGSIALDAGCGVNAPLTRKFEADTRIVGIDLCSGLPSDVHTVTGDLSMLPFRDGTFSVIFSRSVFEHLEKPEIVFKEFYRVLQPGGVCLVLTPNRFDYSSVVASLTPQWFHRWFVGKVYHSASYDTFPTVYRANTPGFFRGIARNGMAWKIRRLTGLRHYPANLAFSRLLFRIGILYDWLIARAGFTALQPSLLVVMERRELGRQRCSSHSCATRP